ncbi:hypothetical protein CFC21_077167 [Triticum aestivum]|uniref:Uncharacterized protein n=2 Tax=Triticum aestivum TaxID=4565 RepID=A0A3B6MQ58_WHEAT|nr:hypothetical protein CFC21_077167 [Triticum aestivum]
MSTIALSSGFHAMLHILSSNFCLSMSCLDFTSQTSTCLSRLAVARYLPFGDQQRLHIGCSCSPFSVNTSSAVSLSYMTTLFLSPGTARVCPSGLQHRVFFTEWSEPNVGATRVKLRASLPKQRSQKMTVPKLSIDAR